MKQLLVLVATLAAIGVNVAATALPLNGLTTGEISDSFSVFFVPAGYVFAIWGVIYLGLLAYAIYQIWPSNRGHKRLQSVSTWYIISSIANAGWIILWHYQYVELSVVAMLVLLGSLIMVYRQLKIGERRYPMWRTLFVNVPFSIYLGWISVATIANVTVVLTELGWDGFGLDGELWAAAMMVVAANLTGAMLLRRKDFVYTAVILWALVGIYAKFPDVNQIRDGLIASVVIILLAMGYAGYKLIRSAGLEARHEIT